MKKALICDLDMTLIDSAQDIAAALSHTIGQVSGKDVSEEQILPMVGTGVQKLLDQYLPGLRVGMDQKSFMQAVKIYRTYYLDHCAVYTTVYPSVEPALRVLLDRQIKLAVASNRWGETIQQICRKLSLDSYFSHFQGTNRTKGKPAPDLILKTCESLQIIPRQAVYIGDKVSDVIAGQEAGCTVAAVTYGVDGREALENAGADLVIDDFAEVLTLFE